MKILISWIISALVILAAAFLLPGIRVESFTTALVVALVLGIINATLRPIILALTLPLNILTLGLFTLIVNALLIMLTTYIVPGFGVESFWWALGFSLVLSIINYFIHKIF